MKKNALMIFGMMMLAVVLTRDTGEKSFTGSYGSFA